MAFKPGYKPPSSYDDSFLNDKIQDCIDQNLQLSSVSQATLRLLRDRFKDACGIRADSPSELLGWMIERIKQGDIFETKNAEDDGWRTSKYLRFGGAEQIVRDEAIQRSQGHTFTLDDSACWRELVDELGATQCWTLNPSAQALADRQRQIDTITGNGKFNNYPLWCQQHGQFRYLPCESLAAESDAMVAALSQRVPGWRNQIAGGRGEKPTIQSDSFGELSAKPERVEMESDEFLQFPGSNPPREYSVREAKNDLRNLLFLAGTNQSRGPRRVAAVNRLLSGRKFGE